MYLLDTTYKSGQYYIIVKIDKNKLLNHGVWFVCSLPSPRFLHEEAVLYTLTESNLTI